MRIILAVYLILLASAGSLFAENSLYINNNNKTERKIINLSEQDIKNLVDKDDPVLVFKKKTETLNNASAGDLLVAGACKDIPQGFIRKVVVVREVGDKLVIETINGTFADMLQCKVSAPPAKN
jgi:hypothetical protein